MNDIMTMEQVIREYNSAELLSYLNKIEKGGDHEKVVQRCTIHHTRWYGEQDCSILVLAVNLGKSEEVISKLIDIGGKELVLMKTAKNKTALHYACQEWGNEHMSINIISKMIEVGGKELLMMIDKFRYTALHSVCAKRNASADIVSKMIEVGGKELLMMRNYYGNTALHNAILHRNVSIDIVSTMIEAGGKELLMMGGKDGGSALHFACRNRSVPIDIVSKMIEVGGQELLMMSNKFGNTALHWASRNRSIALDIVSKLIEVGGEELLIVENKHGDIALHSLHSGYYINDSPQYSDVFGLLAKGCISANIGGEFGIGGLFNSSRQEVQNEIYEKWEELSPALKSTLESLQEHPQHPILHAAILAKAPSHVICNIINCFEDSVLKTDSLNRLPIGLAIEEDLGWSEGLQQIVEATSMLDQKRSIVYTATQCGLKWSNHMKELAEANADEVMDGYDGLTGLRSFMVAATGYSNDLSSIYGMMRMNPSIKNNIH